MLKSNESYEEKRKYARSPARFMIEFKVQGPFEVITTFGQRIATSVMVDISEGGVAFNTGDELPIGTILSMKFILIKQSDIRRSEVSKIKVTGEVRNIRQIGKRAYRIGVFFANIATKDKKVLDDFVKNYVL